jgi:hypothetical protein
MRGIFKLFDVVPATQIFYTVIVLLFCLNFILGLMESHLSCLIYSCSLFLCGLFFNDSNAIITGVTSLVSLIAGSLLLMLVRVYSLNEQSERSSTR